MDYFAIGVTVALVAVPAAIGLSIRGRGRVRSWIFYTAGNGAACLVLGLICQSVVPSLLLGVFLAGLSLFQLWLAFRDLRKIRRKVPSSNRACSILPSATGELYKQAVSYFEEEGFLPILDICSTADDNRSARYFRVLYHPEERIEAHVDVEVPEALERVEVVLSTRTSAGEEWVSINEPFQPWNAIASGIRLNRLGWNTSACELLTSHRAFVVPVQASAVQMGKAEDHLAIMRRDAERDWAISRAAGLVEELPGEEGVMRYTWRGCWRLLKCVALRV